MSGAGQIRPSHAAKPQMMAEAREAHATITDRLNMSAPQSCPFDHRSVGQASFPGLARMTDEAMSSPSSARTVASTV